MRSQPTQTSGRRVLALVVAMLVLGAASIGVDAATGHAAPPSAAHATQR